MDKILSFIFEAIKLFGRLSLDIESMPDGKWKICITIDPKNILK